MIDCLDFRTYKTFLQNGILNNYKNSRWRSLEHAIANSGIINNYGTILLESYYAASSLGDSRISQIDNSGGIIYNYPSAIILDKTNFEKRVHESSYSSSWIEYPPFIKNKNGFINNSGYMRRITEDEPTALDMYETDVCGTVFTVRRPESVDRDNIYTMVSQLDDWGKQPHPPIKGEITNLAIIEGISMINFRLNYNSNNNNVPFEYILTDNVEKTETIDEQHQLYRLPRDIMIDHISLDASSHIIIADDLLFNSALKFENNGKISNAGFFGVYTELSNNEFASIDNSGTLNVSGGTIHNHGTIKNTGTIIRNAFFGNPIDTLVAAGAAGDDAASAGGAVGDPYIVPLNGVGVWKMPNFEGFSRMLQGIYKGKQLTINAKTTFNSEKEIKETIKFATQGLDQLGVDYSHLLKTHKMFSKNESFIRELWIQYGNKETYINLETLHIIGNDFTLNKTTEAAYLIDYDCHESNNIQVTITEGLFIIASNFDNPQVKTGFNINGDTKSIQNPNGVLCNKLYKEDMLIKSMSDIEPISQTKDREPKGYSNEIYFNSNGEKMTKRINLY